MSVATNKSAAPAPNPTEAQIQAGNYKKDHLTLQGLKLAIENLKGSVRKGVDKGGSRWSVKMPADYGYVKSHEGKDGDDVDVYVGPNRDGYMVYVINQKDLGTGRFDEHKCMLGFKTKKQAISTYLKGFSDGSGIRRIQGIKSMTMPQFKAWLSVPANLKKQASAKEQLKIFIAQNFGKTARLEKTAGVEVKCLADVATALKAFMLKQSQAVPTDPFEVHKANKDALSKKPGSAVPVTSVPPVKGTPQVQPTVPVKPVPNTATITPVK